MTSKIGPREQALREMRREDYPPKNRRPIPVLPKREEKTTMETNATAPETGAPMPEMTETEPKAPAPRKKAPAKKAAPKKPKAAAKAKGKPAAKEGGKSKTEMVLSMLKRAKGCTALEVCEATGWAAVSIPPIAARAGLKLKKEKIEGGAIRYRAA